MFLLYDLVFVLYAIFYLPYLLLTKRGYAGYSMRFGIFSPQVKKQMKQFANIWVHAVSVGEVMVLDGVIDLLRRDHSAYQVIVTVTTRTGYALAQERLKGKALVIPSPLDLSGVVRGFVSLIDPKIYIAVETEIWPNLYSHLHHRNIPLTVINGRISEKSFGRYRRIRFLLKNILKSVSFWCMQNQRDADRIMELGAEASRIMVTGNIKFDGHSKGPEPSFPGMNADGLWWVAGSTHPGEEEIVLDVYAKLLEDNSQWRLVIAPRHVDRVPQIMELISQRGLEVKKLSELNNGDSPYAIIVVDTIGQLRSLYSLASLVFVGKSLCGGGGQNVIEPAFYGKAIVIGPRVENFRDIVDCFKQADAIVQVQDAMAFEKVVRELGADRLKREQLGKAALKVIAMNQGAASRSLERLAEFIR